MLMRQLFDPETSTYTYLLADEATREAVLIDPVLEQVDRDLQVLRELDLTLRWAVDTHVHADHVTGLGTLRERTGCKTVLSERAGTGCADVLVKQGDRIPFGAHALEVRETPGHTNGCVTYVTDDHTMAFTGDALLIRGCGRTDFQQGDARTLYRSIREQVFTLPDTTRIYPGHDYKGRTVSTVGEEKRWNPRLGVERTEDEFVDIMAKLQLAYPKKIDVALPANLQCGVPRGTPVTPEAPPVSPWAPVVWSAGGVPEVTPEWVAAGAAGARVVDVREASEFNNELGHVPGSELVPLGAVVDVAARWDREAPVVLVCRSGGRSGKAALALLERGFRKVVSMRGGMLAWNAQRLPVARG
jgi:glyoxylase-like metal-dependent hydrolase (beta-lactamase superfamily II)/rhodanese-related sulfurtransferase